MWKFFFTNKFPHLLIILFTWSDNNGLKIKGSTIFRQYCIWQCSPNLIGFIKHLPKNRWKNHCFWIRQRDWLTNCSSTYYLKKFFTIIGSFYFVIFTSEKGTTLFYWYMTTNGYSFGCRMNILIIHLYCRFTIICLKVNFIMNLFWII